MKKARHMKMDIREESKGSVYGFIIMRHDCVCPEVILD